jgi:uncharacterized protein (TIGR02646 family)
MRKIVREELDVGTVAVLANRQAEANRHRAAGTLDVGPYWNTIRSSADFRPVLSALRRMAGDAERCMYCLDSQGTDVEHFWPKKPYPERMAVWTNMLLGCTPCGRFKGHRFPLDGAGSPLLVDPTTDDPWEHLDFDVDTGNLTARYDVTGTASAKGTATVSLLQFDRREALQRLYRRSFLRLCNAVDSAISSGTPSPVAFVELLRGLDDHGLLGWCFSDRGAGHEAFSRLQRSLPDVWRACVAAFAA